MFFSLSVSVFPCGQLFIFFKKQKSSKIFPSQDVHSCEEAHRLHRVECSFYRECLSTLTFLLRTMDDLSVFQALFRKTYHVLMRVDR